MYFGSPFRMIITCKLSFNIDIVLQLITVIQCILWFQGFFDVVGNGHMPPKLENLDQILEIVIPRTLVSDYQPISEVSNISGWSMIAKIPLKYTWMM